MDNSSALLNLTNLDGSSYTVPFISETEFDTLLLQSDDLICPVEVGLNEWLLSLYDIFISTIKSIYQSNRIILIKSHVPQFYFSNKYLHKSLHGVKARSFLQELDEYFILKTDCIILDTPCRFIEHCENPKGQIFLHVQQDLKLALEVDVVNAIESNMNESAILNVPCDSIYSLDFDKQNGGEIHKSLNINQKHYDAAKYIWEKNIKILKDYKYCNIDLMRLRWEKQVFFKLDRHHFINVKDNKIRLVDITPALPWDFNRFIEKNYTCDVGEIEDALMSWETYFERGRRGENSPFILRYDTMVNFVQSLCIIDYEDILTNEYYIITIDNDTVASYKYLSKVDLSFFFKKDVLIWNISAGWADQVRCVNVVHKICKENNWKCIFDDLIYDKYFLQSGLTVNKTTNVINESNTLSTLVSKKLRNRRIFDNDKEFSSDDWTHTILYIKQGLSDVHYVFPSWALKSLPDSICKKTITMIDNKNRNKLKQIIEAANTNTKCVIISYLDFPKYREKKIMERIFTFDNLPVSNIKNEQIMKQCMSTDAIAIHVRRGDQIWWYKKRGTPTDWMTQVKYKKALKKVYKSWKFRKYKDKHLFIFSDDMEYVRKNVDELGITLAGDCVTYVDWNYHLDDINDARIISSCKIIIKSVGQFAHVAGMISRRVECIIDVNEIFAYVSWRRKGFWFERFYDQKSILLKKSLKYYRLLHNHGIIWFVKKLFS